MILPPFSTYPSLNSLEVHDCDSLLVPEQKQHTQAHNNKLTRTDRAVAVAAATPGSSHGMVDARDANCAANCKCSTDGAASRLSTPLFSTYMNPAEKKRKTRERKERKKSFY